MRFVKWLLCLSCLLFLLGSIACDEGSSAPPINPDGLKVDGAKDGGVDQSPQIDKGPQADKGPGADQGGAG